MSDTLWPLPKNLKQGSPSIDPASVVKGTPDFAKMVATRVAGSPNYKALAGKEQSFGPAGLLPAAGAAFGPLAAAGGALAGSAAVPLAAAYGIGKLVAPKFTDETVQKLKDLWTSKVSPLINKGEAIGSAYETGMAHSIPGSRFLEKKLPQETQDYLTQIKNQHPLAATAGQTAGTIGAMALPGANIVKGAGLLGTAANAAINAAPFALGTGLDVGATTGDVKKGVLAGLGSEALGTAVPTAISGLAKIPAVSRWLAKLQFGAAGGRTKDVLGTSRGYAKSIGASGSAIDTIAEKKSDDLIQQAADLIGEFGGTRAGKKRLKGWHHDGWEAHAKLWDNLTDKSLASDDLQAIFNDSDLAQVRARFGDQKVIQNILERSNEIKGQGWTNSRDVLEKYWVAGNDFQHLRPTDPAVLDSAVASAMRDRLDTVADHFAIKANETLPEGGKIPDLHLLKATTPAVKSLSKAGSREAGNIPGHFAGGSDTFARAALQWGPSALAGGAAAPGAIGDMISNPENIPADIGKIAAASVLGRMLSRGAGRLGELGAGAAAGAVRGAGEVPNAALGRLLGQSGELMAPQQGGAMPTGGTLGSSPPDQVIPQNQMAPQGPQPIQPQMGNAPSGAQPIPNAPAGPPPVEPIQNAPAGPSPQEIAQADFQQAGHPPQKIGKWSEPFVEARIQEKWRRYQRQYGEVPYEEYKAGALRATQDLDPSLPATWQAMFDDKETGTKLYNGYMNLQKLTGVDPGAALNFYYPTRMLTASLEDRRKQDIDNAKLVQALSDMTKQPVKEINHRLSLIAWKKSMNGEQKKQAVLDMIVNEGGIDVPLLVKMGLW
jgi:hypothetical protein